MMLKYKLHYKAIEVCKFMDFTHSIKSMVYVDWACCKVESKESDEQLFQMI